MFKLSGFLILSISLFCSTCQAMGERSSLLQNKILCTLNTSNNLKSHSLSLPVPIVDKTRIYYDIYEISFSEHELLLRESYDQKPRYVYDVEVFNSVEASIKLYTVDIDEVFSVNDQSLSIICVKN